jgi:hypothetical protein
LFSYLFLGGTVDGNAILWEQRLLLNGRESVELPVAHFDGCSKRQDFFMPEFTTEPGK